MSNDEGPRVDVPGALMTAGEVVPRSVSQPGDVVIRRREPTPAPAADCPRVHPGECDQWSTCTGLLLTVAERDAAGRAHPWRVAA